MNSTPKASVPSSRPIAVDLDEPYPVLAVDHRNAQYARMLECDLGSAHSEISSVCQYAYQSWVLDPAQAELIDLCSRIAQVEMHHLHILGKLIEMLGGTPRYAAPTVNGYQPWNGNMLHYSRDPQVILRNNIDQEQAAGDLYEAQAGRIHDPHIAAMLHRMAKAEFLHRDIFQSCLDRLNR